MDDTNALVRFIGQSLCGRCQEIRLHVFKRIIRIQDNIVRPFFVDLMSCHIDGVTQTSNRNEVQIDYKPGLNKDRHQNKTIYYDSNKCLHTPIIP